VDFPILALLILLAAALVWAGHRSAVERRIRIGCGLLKLAGVLTLALCLLEPLQSASAPGRAPTFSRSWSMTAKACGSRTPAKPNRAAICCAAN
jgi:hypothetical protein